MHGIGETFSPDLHTGTGNFTVPVALPPGRNGFQPQLNLVYSTGNGNGPYGLRWALSIPGVSRKASRGIPRYGDERGKLSGRDTFLLSGAEDLVPVAETAGAIRYRPRTEGLFARIEHHSDSQTDHWEVRSKDGLVSVYGDARTIRRSSLIRRIDVRSSIGDSRRPGTRSGIPSVTTMKGTWAILPTIFGTNSASGKYVMQTTTIRKLATRNSWSR